MSPVSGTVDATAGITVRAAAKINLHLGVGGPRDDGFHPLTTVYQAVGLCDDVTATPADALHVTQDAAAWIDAGSVPLDHTNIAHRAALALGRHHDVVLSAHLRVEKSIPVAAGLAGGSADAAAALVALDRLFDLHTDDDDLLAIAAGLGSDVPFALLGGTALGTGRGEQVEPVEDVGSCWWVLVPGREGLSTPAVYRHFDTLYPGAPPTPPDADAVLAALRTGEPLALARSLHNDLQEPAIDLRPELGELLERGEAEGALRGIVSGSGPTCAFLCEDVDAARELSGALPRLGHETVLVATAPVAGAHVVHGLGLHG